MYPSLYPSTIAVYLILPVFLLTSCYQYYVYFVTNRDTSYDKSVVYGHCANECISVRNVVILADLPNILCKGK